MGWFSFSTLRRHEDGCSCGVLCWYADSMYNSDVAPLGGLESLPETARLR